VRCPRCHREVPDPTPAFCTQCGAPLRLGDEPEPRPLESSVTIDRRISERLRADDGFTGLDPAGAVAAAAATAEPAGDAAGARGAPAAERSRWDLGAPVPRKTLAPRNTAVRASASPALRAPPPPAAPDPHLDTDVEVEAVEIHMRRAASWRRAAAAAIDVAPFAAGGVALARALLRAAAGLPAPATGLDGLLDLVARERVIVLSVAAAVALALGVYTTLAHALAGATLGKRLLGLRLVGPDGERPSLARSAVRSALAFVSLGLLGLGVLLALFTRSGRSLHDLVARTWVVEAP
jgi:resuscitation-promoting factor RpfA